MLVEGALQVKKCFQVVFPESDTVKNNMTMGPHSTSVQ